MNFKRRTLGRGDSPGRQQLEIGQRLVSPWLHPMGASVTKAPPQKTTRPQGPQALSGAAQQADDCSPVVAAEINRAVEAFPAKSPDERPRKGRFHLASSPAERPDPRQP